MFAGSNRITFSKANHKGMAQIGIPTANRTQPRRGARAAKMRTATHRPRVITAKMMVGGQARLSPVPSPDARGAALTLGAAGAPAAVAGVLAAGAGRRRRLGEMAHHDEARRRAEAGVTGRQREAVVGRGVEDLDITRLHHGAGIHHVVEAARPGRDEDVVARGKLVQPVERGAVGGAVSGDGGVARLTGHRCVGVVTRSLPQLGHARSVDDELVDADLRDLEMGDGLSGRR